MPRQASPAASCRSCRTLGAASKLRRACRRRVTLAWRSIAVQSSFSPPPLAWAARPAAVSAPHVVLHQVLLGVLAWATSPLAGSEPPAARCLFVGTHESFRAIPGCVPSARAGTLASIQGEGASARTSCLGNQQRSSAVHWATPNTSIERTVVGKPPTAAHVER
jgi:hypothetical protein